MIFGLRAEETEHFYTHGGYSSRQLAAEDPKLRMLTESLINGTFNASNYTFWGIFNDLIEQNDPYFVLKDFASYTDAFARLDKIYSDRQRWGRMSLNNIAMSSFFSSDRTIREYVKDIWHTNCN
jgi:starch phosphorylase